MKITAIETARLAERPCHVWRYGNRVGGMKVRYGKLRRPDAVDLASFNWVNEIELTSYQDSPSACHGRRFPF